jgi:hypothetical protein
MDSLAGVQAGRPNKTSQQEKGAAGDVIGWRRASIPPDRVSAEGIVRQGGAGSACFGQPGAQALSPPTKAPMSSMKGRVLSSGRLRVVDGRARSRKVGRP